MSNVQAGLKPGQATLTISGNTQIGLIPILGFSFTIVAPRDASTGQASGKRQWKPIVVTKEWGASSPKLLGIMNSHTVVPKVSIQFGGSDRWISLLDAQIAAIDRTSIGGKLQERLTLIYQRVVMGKGASGRPLTDTHELERIALTFQKITVENKGGKSTFKDDWLSA
jgi:type VI secretion system secreted protein Hcp